MTLPIYAIGTEQRPAHANRWMAQSGGYWCAVMPSESAEEWFDEGYPNIPGRVLPIEALPSEGVLRFLDAAGEELTVDTTEMPRLIQTWGATTTPGLTVVNTECRVTLESTARAIAEADDEDCFTIIDAWNSATEDERHSGEIPDPAAAQEDAAYYYKLARAALTSLAPKAAAK